MTFILHRKKYPVRDLTDFNVLENDLLRLSGVAEIGIREGDKRWRTLQVNGEIDLLEHLGIQGTPDDYELSLDGHELTLSVGRAHFTEQQVDEMVHFLGSQEYRLDTSKAGGHVSRILSVIQDDIESFIQSWKKLSKVVEAIVWSPGGQLTTDIQEMSLQHRQRHNAATLALNLRTGRLNAQGQPTVDTVFALSDHVTLDIAENSHLVKVVETYELRRDLLLDRAKRQLRSLQLDIARWTAEGRAENQIAELQERDRFMSDLTVTLQMLEPLPLPETWRSFRHKPSISTNRSRFDERYKCVIELENELQERTVHSRRPPHALELIQECGKRATWQLYEYWLLAKIFTQLIDLKFNCNGASGFQAFEDWRGGGYGLVENSKVTFTHESGLQVSLTYEKHIPFNEQGKQIQLKPDVVLEIENLEQSVPLVIDAKYKKYSMRHAKLDRDLEKSARRYGRAMGGAMSYLVHAGRDWQAWPSRSKFSHDPPRSPFKPEDLPLNHGIIGVFPGAEIDGIEEDVRPLRRLLVAWLIRNGIFWICFNCGANLKDQDTSRTVRLPGERNLDVNQRHTGYTVANRNWPKFESYQCPCCGMTGMLTFCGTCATGSQGHWEPIFKYVPTEVAGGVKDTVASDSWSKIYEIHHVDRIKRHLRHCALCGATQ